jgi:PKD repeat protein
LEGVPVSLNGAGSSDPNPGGTLSYAWNYGDGATGTGAIVGHAFHAGTWNVTLTVTDSLSGLKGSVSHLVVVADEGPTLAFTAPSGRAGQSLAFAGVGSDADGSIAAFIWNFGDGGTGSGPNPTHVYAKAGSYTVVLIVIDTSGKSANVSHIVTVAPRPVVCTVPRLKGMTLTRARRALGSAHCALGKTHAPPKKPKRSAGKGKHWALVVTKQSLAPNTTHSSETKVGLTVVYRAIRN